MFVCSCINLWLFQHLAHKYLSLNMSAKNKWTWNYWHQFLSLKTDIFTSVLFPNISANLWAENAFQIRGSHFIGHLKPCLSSQRTSRVWEAQHGCHCWFWCLSSLVPPQSCTWFTGTFQSFQSEWVFWFILENVIQPMCQPTEDNLN